MIPSLRLPGSYNVLMIPVAAGAFFPLTHMRVRRECEQRWSIFAGARCRFRWRPVQQLLELLGVHSHKRHLPPWTPA